MTERFIQNDAQESLPSGSLVFEVTSFFEDTSFFAADIIASVSDNSLLFTATVPSNQYQYQASSTAPTAPATVTQPPVIIPVETGDLNAYFAAFNIETSVFRVAFDASLDPYTVYTQGYFGILQSEDGQTKTFAGFFETAAGGVVHLINIPLVGQSLGALAKNLNAYSVVRAEILNNSYLLNTSCLEVSPLQRATGVWSFFFKMEECLPPSTGVSTLKKDIKFFLTSVEPLMAQSNPTQSLGGFVSPTTVYTTSVLSQPVSFYDTFMIFADSNLTSFNTVQIDDEIISIDNWQGNRAIIKKRSDYGTPVRFHAEGTVARGIKKSDVFDGVLSKSNTQYRCIAIKNTSSTEIARDVKVYFKISSRNAFSTSRLAIEIPSSDYFSGTSSGGKTSEIKCSGLVDKFSDGHFVNAPLTFTSGQNESQTRLISGFSSSKGTLTLSEPMPFTPQSGDAFYIDTAPSQIISSGVYPPKTTPGNNEPPFIISGFEQAFFERNGISIDINGERENGSNLHPNEVVYVWIERNIGTGNEEFLNNRSVLSISYSRV